MKKILSILLIIFTIITYSSDLAFAEAKAIDFYNYSDWAYEELEKAELYGLITDKVRPKMNANITREEFAEIVARLYEVYFGKSATPASTDTFTDTYNVEILKAYNLGIVNGIGNNKFEPNKLATREQIAAMLTRFIKIIAPTADFKPTDAPKFNDDKDISAYCKDDVNFMAKWEFIKGSNNKFNPKNNCTREEAVIITKRIYEYFLLLALGYFDTPQTTEEPVNASSDLIGFWSSIGLTGTLYDSYTGVPVSSYYDGQWYEFFKDGTFKYTMIGAGQIISGIIVWTGNYKINGDTVTLSNILETWTPSVGDVSGVKEYKDKKRESDEVYTFRFEGTDTVYMLEQGYSLENKFYRVIE